MDYARASQIQPEPPKIIQSRQEPPKNHPEPAKASQSQLEPARAS